MKLRELLKNKGFEVIAIDGDSSVSNAIEKMVERNIGALVIMQDDEPVGIFTERDVLKCWKERHTYEGYAIKDVMSKNLIVAKIDEDLNYVMGIIIQKGIRHVPVVDAGKLVSVLSIRDVVKAQVDGLEQEVRYLKDFITDGG